MKLKLNTAPANPAVSVLDAKTHLRVDHSDDDAYIQGLIEAATSAIETEANRQLITATWDQHLDYFPDCKPIMLYRPPVQSIESITYTDEDGSTQTVSTSTYKLTDPNNAYATVTLQDNQNWPTDEIDERDAVKVTYKAGYGDSDSDVPRSLRVALLMLVATLYECRSDALDVRLAQNPAAQRLIQSEMIPIV